MSYRYLCTVWINGVPAEQHFFNMPLVISKGGYTAVTSYNAVRQREVSRHHKFRTKGKECPRRLAIDDVFSLMHVRNLPTFFHETIWDMYIAVGYSYKKKRFLKPGEKV